MLLMCLSGSWPRRVKTFGKAVGVSIDMVREERLEDARMVVGTVKLFTLGFTKKSAETFFTLLIASLSLMAGQMAEIPE